MVSKTVSDDTLGIPMTYSNGMRTGGGNRGELLTSASAGTLRWALKHLALPAVVAVGATVATSGPVASPAAAQQVWTGTVDSDWGTAGNWNPADVPDTATEAAVFDASAANQSVDLGGAAFDSLRVIIDDGNYNLSNGTLNLTEDFINRSAAGQQTISTVLNVRAVLNQSVGSLFLSAPVTGNLLASDGSIFANADVTGNAQANGGSVAVLGALSGTLSATDGVAFHVEDPSFASVIEGQIYQGITPTGGGTFLSAGPNGVVSGGNSDAVSIISSAPAATLRVRNAASISSAGGDGIHLEANSSGVNVDVEAVADVTGQTDGIDITAEGAGIDLRIGSTATITGTTGTGVLINDTGPAGSPTVVLAGASGTIIGATDGVNTTTAGADISVSNLDLVQGGDNGIVLTSNGGDILVIDVDEVQGTNGDGIDANSGAGALTIRRNGFGTVAGTNGQTGGIAGGDDGIEAASTTGAILITANEDINGAAGDGVNASSTSGTITVVDNAVISGGDNGVSATTDGDITIQRNTRVLGSTGAAIAANASTGNIVIAAQVDGISSVFNVGIDADTTTGNIDILNNTQFVDQAIVGQGGIDADSVGGTITVAGNRGIFGNNRTALEADTAGDVAIRDNASIRGAEGIIANTSTGAGAITITGNATGPGENIQGRVGDAIAATSGAGAITVTGNGEVSGEADGMDLGSGAGDITVVAGSQVTGQTGDGVNAASTSGAVSVTVTDEVNGASEGIGASTGGAADLTVVANANVTGDTDDNGVGDGIRVQNSGTGSTLVTGSGAVQGLEGIVALGTGGGDVTVTGTGNTIGTGTNGAVIRAQASMGAGNILINRSGNATNADAAPDQVGISATQRGTGTTTVQGVGQVFISDVSGFAAGIDVTAGMNAGDTTINMSEDITIFGTATTGFGIRSRADNAANTTITMNGDIDLPGSATSGAGIGVSDGGSGGASGATVINANGNINGGGNGIRARNMLLGAGDSLTINNRGTIGTFGPIGQNGIAVNLLAGSTGTVDITNTGGIDAGNAGRDGIVVDGADGTVTVSNTATIDAGARGIAVSTELGDIDVSGAGAITVNDTAGVTGIRTRTSGGNVSITGVGPISAPNATSNAQGIQAINTGPGGDITILTNNAIDLAMAGFDSNGIVVDDDGTGDVSVTSRDITIGTTSVGANISVSGGQGDITVVSGGALNGGSFGIQASASMVAGDTISITNTGGIGAIDPVGLFGIGVEDFGSGAVDIRSTAPIFSLFDGINVLAGGPVSIRTSDVISAFNHGAFVTTLGDASFALGGNDVFAGGNGIEIDAGGAAMVSGTGSIVAGSSGIFVRSNGVGDATIAGGGNTQFGGAIPPAIGVGLVARARGDGDVSITRVGDITLTGTAGTGVGGVSDGIGAITIDGIGNINMGNATTDSDGVVALNNGPSGDVTIVARGIDLSNALGDSNGVFVEDMGTGNVSVQAGAIRLADGSFGAGIGVSSVGGNVDITPAGPIDGGSIGIAALADTPAGGAVNVDIGRPIGGMDAVTDFGVLTTVGGTGTAQITARAAITSDNLGIATAAGGSVAKTIDQTGTVTAGNVGIFATGAMTSTTAVNANGRIDAGNTAIAFGGFDDASAAVVVNGRVEATADDTLSLFAENGDVALTLNRGVTSTGAAGIRGGAADGAIDYDINADVMGVIGIDVEKTGAAGDVNVDIASGVRVAGTTGRAVHMRGAGGSFNFTNNGLLGGADDGTGGRVDITGFNPDTSTFTNNSVWFAQGSPSVISGNFVNNGIIDMSDGDLDDTVTVQGAYTGNAGSQLSLDVDLTNPAGGAANADQLILTPGKANNGSTNVDFQFTMGTGVLLTQDIPIVVNGATQTNFVAGPIASSGFVDYAFVRAGDDYVIRSALNAQRAGSVLGALPAAISAANIAFSTPTRAAIGGSTQQRTEGEIDYAVWTRGLAGFFEAESEGVAVNNRGGTAAGAIGAKARTQFGGVQSGIDVARFDMDGRGTAYLGVTGGVMAGRTNNDVSRIRYDMPFLGVYGRINRGAFTFDAMVRRDWYDVHTYVSGANGSGIVDADSDGDGWSALLQANYSTKMGSLDVRGSADLFYSHIDLDRFPTLNGDVVAIDAFDTIVGKAVVNVSRGFLASSQKIAYRPFFEVGVQHDFGDDISSALVGNNNISASSEKFGTQALLGAGVQILNLDNDWAIAGKVDVKLGERLNGLSGNVVFRKNF